MLWSVVDDLNTGELVADTRTSLDIFPLEEGVSETFIDAIAVYFEVCDAAKLVVCVSNTL